MASLPYSHCHCPIHCACVCVCSTFIVVANTKGLRSNTHAPNTLIHDYALTLTQMAVMRGSGWVVDIIRITRTTSDSNLRLLEVNQHSYAGKLPDALTLRYIYTIGRNNSARRLLSMKIWIWIIVRWIRLVVQGTQLKAIISLHLVMIVILNWFWVLCIWLRKVWIPNLLSSSADRAVAILNPGASGCPR